MYKYLFTGKTSRFSVVVGGALLLSLLFLLFNIAFFETYFIDMTTVFYRYTFPFIVVVISAALLFSSPNGRTIIISTIITLFLADFLLGVVPKLFNPARPRAHSYTTWLENNATYFTAPDYLLGNRPHPNSKVSVEKRIDDTNEVIYSAIYTIDQFSRRVVPEQTDDAESFLLFFGGSRTYGEGVNDDETLAYHVSKGINNKGEENATEDYKAYMYSFSAWGPNQFMAILDHRNVAEEVTQRSGIVVYPIIEHHLARLLGDYYIVAEWMDGRTPYYENIDGTYTYKGGFVRADIAKTLFYGLVTRSNILKRVFAKTIDIEDEENIEKMADFILGIKNKLTNIISQDRFIVTIMPGNKRLTKLKTHLLERGIECFDMSNLFNYNDMRFIHHARDTHYNAAGYKKMADSLSDYIINHEKYLEVDEELKIWGELIHEVKSSIEMSLVDILKTGGCAECKGKNKNSAQKWPVQLVGSEVDKTEFLQLSRSYLEHLLTLGNISDAATREALLTDPWGNPYFINENEGENPSNTSYSCKKDTIRSAGRDNLLRSDDDILVFVENSMPLCQ